MNYKSKAFFFLSLFLVPITMQATKIADLPADGWTIEVIREEDERACFSGSYVVKNGDDFQCSMSLVIFEDQKEGLIRLSRFQGISREIFFRLINLVHGDIHFRILRKQSHGSGLEFFTLAPHTHCDFKEALIKTLIQSEHLGSCFIDIDNQLADMSIDKSWLRGVPDKKRISLI